MPASVLKPTSDGIFIMPIASNPPIIINPKNAHAPNAIAKAGPTNIPIITKMAAPIYDKNFILNNLLFN